MAMDQARLQTFAERFDVPFNDVLFIALNAEGARASIDYPRLRMQLRPNGSEEAWQVILPLDSPDSPFYLDGEHLWLGTAKMARLVAYENDDVVLTYLRKGGRSLTLNTYARSTCTGCVFCPNVIEDASDAILTDDDQFDALFSWVTADNSWEDLSEVDVITVCSGCFHNPKAAIDHFATLRASASRRRFSGELHLLSSVIREPEDLRALADASGSLHLTLTLECFTRRSLLLKESKASLTLEWACDILDTCKELGIKADFTYVAGLDPLESAIEGLCELATHVTTFPRIQVYQAHNDYMRRTRSRDATSLGYYLKLRQAVEPAFAKVGLAPASWENYRPLWYGRFWGESVCGPRV